ncbi:hypothetical protein ACFWFF_26135 [Streptomyces sp. NPDC060223]|uniref:hypothetical protein n=1 Tax=unclassified Streptomyces TaxID=2593676 RepID=UPI003634DB51
MTAATTATRPLTRRPSPLTPHGTVWTSLRLHRAALLIWAALVTVTAAGLLWAYGPGADAARKEPYLLQLSCGTDNLCADTTGNATLWYDAVAQLATSSIVYLPYLVAAWAGATLVARELESGTAALAWTQSVTPARWLATQLAVPAALVTAGTTVLVLLHRLMWIDGHQDVLYQDWYATDAYRSNGTVAVGAALCALAVGALAGMLVRRTLPALGVAVLVTVAVQTLGDLYRDSLWPVVTVTGAAASRIPDSAALVKEGVTLTSGERIGNNLACVDYDTGADLMKCMSENGISDLWATYHPSSHFWPLQLTETALLLTVTALAVFLSFRVLKRRTA